MRKFLALALTGLLAVTVASFAFAHDDVQSIDAKLTPTKLDKKKYKPAKIMVDIVTEQNDEDTTFRQPPSADRTKVDFSKNMKFDTGSAPNCKATEAQLQNTTTAQAIEACGKGSIVSVADPDDPEKRCKNTCAEVTADAGPVIGVVVAPVVVTAFNGTKDNQLYLHARSDTFNNTSVLVGKLKKGPTGYGKTLDVTIPDLDTGAISKFKVTVKEGKYVQARCKSKTNKFQATTQYENHSDSVNTDTTKCKRK